MPYKINVNLAIWWILLKIKFSGGHNVIAVSSHAWDAKLKKRKSVQMAHAKFSRYTVSGVHE